MQRIETWKKLTGLLNEKKTRVKALGVSNFEIEHIEEIKKGKLPLPSVNQIEFSPFLYRKNLLDYCKKHGIIVEAYSPLTRGKRLSDPRIETIAKKHEKTPAQILLRWALQHNTVIIPKSSNPEHIKENSEIFDFALSKEDMNILDSFGGAYYSIINPDLLGILFSVATRLRNLFS
jgi:diketogulonate reductase-like aldo/keto reductase